MTAIHEREAPLTPGDVRRILKVCGARGLLVGGQALAFWADNLGVRLPGALASGVTADADFVGDARLARELGSALGWKTWIPSPDDATPETGKVTCRLADGAVKQVDFLSGVVGLATRDLLRRSFEIEIPGIGRLRVIHPLDVLESRIQNLHLLPGKRSAAGIAQAQLAVDMVQAFIRRTVETDGERRGLALLERIVDMAGSPAALRVHLSFEIDPLAAVPLDAFRTTTALHRRRWPQIQKDLTRRREALRRTVASRRPRGKGTHKGR